MKLHDAESNNDFIKLQTPKNRPGPLRDDSSQESQGGAADDKDDGRGNSLANSIYAVENESTLSASVSMINKFAKFADSQQDLFVISKNIDEQGNEFSLGADVSYDDHNVSPLLQIGQPNEST